VECNRRYSDDSEYFRDVLAIGDTCSSHPEVVKLLQGKIRRKIQKRRGALLKNLTNIGIRPIFTESGLYVGHGPQFDCDWDRIEVVLKNVMRGVFVTLMKYPMPQEMALTVGQVRDEHDLLQLRRVITAMGPWMGFGDDVFGCRAVFHSTGTYMHCLMRFYRTVLFYGQGLLPSAQIATVGC
jgi:hypothetical protein